MITEKVKKNPTWFYAFSIAATWAGAGSLIVGTQMVQDYGVLPFILWALGNSLCCVLFGALANKLPKLRAIFTSKVFKIVVGLMCVFQLWVNMSGVADSLSIINHTFAVVATYGISILFLILYLKQAILRNAITDSGSWWIVYVLIFALAFLSIAINGANLPTLGVTHEGISLGVQRFFTLLIGPFFYPYFWELFDYNENTEDGTKTVNMKKCFYLGGMLFGIYICFVFVLGITSFTPALEIVKGILLATIAFSSLTSFIYSIYISFGKKVGLVVNVLGFVGWYFLIPLGVMSIWSAMQDIRFIIAVGTIIVAIIWEMIKKHKKADLKEQKSP